MLFSLHDIAPPFQPRLERLWDLCAAAGVLPALCVVPNWHGRWPLHRYPQLVRWIRACVNHGAEVVLHGECHHEMGSPRHWTDTVKAWHHTARVAEFIALGRIAAVERMRRGSGVLRALGLEPIGFIPPAWLCREDTHHAAHEVGFRFSEDMTSIRLHDSHHKVHAPVIRWSGRSRARALVLAALGEWRWASRSRHRAYRLALHPKDLNLSLSRACVSRALRTWTEGATQLSYSQLADELPSWTGEARAAPFLLE